MVWQLRCTFGHHGGCADHAYYGVLGDTKCSEWRWGGLCFGNDWKKWIR
jgi:hypothetical protein